MLFAAQIPPDIYSNISKDSIGLWSRQVSQILTVGCSAGPDLWDEGAGQ